MPTRLPLCARGGGIAMKLSGTLSTKLIAPRQFGPSTSKFDSAAIRAISRCSASPAAPISAGFAEIGAAGLAEQREIARIAAESNLLVEGPNCLGAINFVDNVPLSFIAMPPPRAQSGKRVGIVSQSGAMAAVVAVTLIAKELPLSFFISTGNEAASGVED